MQLTPTHLFILSVIVTIVTQVVKVYRQRRGKEPSKKSVEWFVFSISVILSVAWQTPNLLTVYKLFVFSQADPAALAANVLGIAGDIIVMLGSILGLTRALR